MKVLKVLTMLLVFASCSVQKLQITGATSKSSHSENAPLGNTDETDNPATSPTELPGGNPEITAKPGVQTATVVSANRALMDLVSCTGIKQPSLRSKSMWENKTGQFSIEGRANSISSPMLMAHAAVAAEICLDLIEIESALNQTDRRIFTQIDFNQSAAAQSVSALSDGIRRLARSCWGRNETTEEHELIVTAATGGFDSGDSAESQMIFLCASMLSSVSAIEM